MHSYNYSTGILYIYNLSLVLTLIKNKQFSSRLIYRITLITGCKTFFLLGRTTQS